MGQNHKGEPKLFGLVEKFVIKGCEARGDAESAYLTRYRFPRIGPVRPAAHVFHRSDHDDMHDHPWPFVSVILWRGYIEETPCPHCKPEDPCYSGVPSGAVPYVGEVDRIICGYSCYGTSRIQKRYWPGMVLVRKATHVHRVVLVDDKKAVTLILMGPRCREWGFWLKSGWQHFKDYFKEQGCA